MLMPLSDAQRARFATRTTWVSVVGLLLIPIVIGGMLTWALWEPTQRMDHVTAAVVNNDEPVTIDDQLVPLGRQLAAALVTGEGTADPAATADSATASAVENVSGTGVTTTFDWALSDDDDAAAGLADGTYDVVVTIPEGFSAAATSFTGTADEAQQAAFTVRTSTHARPLDGAIAQVLAATAADVMGAQLTEAYLSNVLVSFTTMSDELGGAADGATDLASGAGGLTDGTVQLGTGAHDLSDGLNDLADGQYTLAAGLARLDDGTGRLSGGVTGLNSGASALASGLDGLDSGANDLATGLATLNAGARQAADEAAAAVPGAQQFADGLNQSATSAAGLSTGFDSLITYAQGLAAACTGGDPVACTDLEDLLSAPETAQLTTGLDSLSTGLGIAAAGGQAIADGTQQSATGLAALADGVAQSSDGAQQLASGANQSAAGAHQLAAGASRIAAGMPELTAGVSGAASGADELAAGALAAAGGAADLAGGVDELASGAGDLTHGAEQLASGLDDAVEQIPTYTDDEATSLAAVIATPVTANDDGSTMLGSSSVPYFMALALWLGSLATFLVLAPLGRESLGSPRSSALLAWRAYWPAAGIGVGQAVLLTVVMAWALHLDVGQWIQFAALAMAGAIAFTAANQGLAALMGNVGRFVSMVVAVVTLATAVISTAPAMLTGVAALLPTAPLIAGLRAVVFDTAGQGSAWTLVILWALGGFAAAVAAIARKRVIDIGQLARWARAT